MIVEGRVKVGIKTKELVRYLEKNDIALLYHNDIDELAALSIIRTGISVVLNTGQSMTGRYYSKGAGLLLKSGIKLYDVALPISHFNDGDHISIKSRDLIVNKSSIHNNTCTFVNEDYINKYHELSKKNISYELKSFIDNTLDFAYAEKNDILFRGLYPELNTVINGKHTVVVARGPGCEEDLFYLKDYIDDNNPVLIGVDGGADLLINYGYNPDILIGDMDSVSDIGIYKSNEIVLHAYKNGYCPCIDRINRLNVRYKTLSMAGTSEDIALLLAYDKGAELIVLVGGHTCMHDFLEKGRKGMGSTLLTRIKIGDKLIDFKGFNKLIRQYRSYYVLQNDSNIQNYSYLTEEEREMLCLKM